MKDLPVLYQSTIISLSTPAHEKLPGDVPNVLFGKSSIVNT